MTAPENAIWLAEVETTVIIETSHGHGGDSVFGSSTSTAVGPEIGSGTVAAGGAGSGTGDGTGDAAPPPPDPTVDLREIEEGEEYDANGQVESRFRIERVIRPDGSSEFRRTEQFTDGRSLEATGSADTAGNGSATIRYTEVDGSSKLTTRTTTDGGAHGTEHTTWFDATGTAVDDDTSEF